MADEETPTAAAPDAPKPSGGGSKLLPIMLGMNSLLLVAVIAVLFLKTGGAAAAKGGHSEDARAEHGEKAEGGEKGKDGKDAKTIAPGPTMRLPDFVVHLRDADSDRYARMSFEVELADEKAKEALSLRVPKIKDSFLAYLSDRSAEELRGSEALARLKETLAKRLGELAPGVQVKALYLTDLVVQ